MTDQRVGSGTALGAALFLVLVSLACKSKQACDQATPCPVGQACVSGACVAATPGLPAAPDPALGNAAPVAAGTARGRSTSAGDPSLFPYGYYDVSGRGAKNDFCQVVRSSRTLQCDTGTGTFQSPSNLDLGYSRTGRMEDANGDGREDFCRCVGNSPNVFYACLLSNGNTFASDQYGLKPPGRTNCDFLNKQAAPAATLPPAPPPLAAAPTDDCGGKCDRFAGTRCVSGSCLLAPNEEWVIAPIAVRVYEGRSCGGRCNTSICLSSTDGSDKHCTPSFAFQKGTKGVSDSRGRYRLGVSPGNSGAKVVTTEQLLRDGIRVEFLDGSRVVERFPRVGRFDGISAGDLLFKGGLVLRLQGNLFYSITVSIQHYVVGD
ncbi:MAG: hypothetical protein KC766_31645 [Myxococcales bacterium]|nr:hypothetical protein [Myxococcales bacterium]